MVGMPTVDQHWPNVGMMLALCPQHWPDVGAGGHWYVGPTAHQWLADGWPNIGPSSAQHWHVYGDFSLKRNDFSLKKNDFSLKRNHFSLKKNR